MSLLHSKGRLESVTDGIDFSEILKSTARKTIESALDNPAATRNGGVAAAAATGASKPLRGFLAKPGFVLAGGIAGITAASAAVSAMRHKQESGEQ